MRSVAIRFCGFCNQYYAKCGKSLPLTHSKNYQFLKEKVIAAGFSPVWMTSEGNLPDKCPSCHEVSRDLRRGGSRRKVRVSLNTPDRDPDAHGRADLR